MKLSLFACALTLLAAFATPAAAQCMVPDNLDGPAGSACFGTQSSVPQRKFTQSALGICWRDCGIDATANYTAVWGALNPTAPGSSTPPQYSCDWYRARLRIYQGAALQWDGQMHFSYSRTWLETPIPGQFIQVWRYLVNGDLRRVSANPVPCGFPPCAPAFGQIVRFTGYVDYAYDCGTTITERAWMITHGCDSIDHAAGFPRAGVFHPNRYYTFVGPSAGFAVGAGGTLEAGALSADCVRIWDAPVLPARCRMEEPILSASINPTTMTCMCGTGPTNWYQGNLTLNGSAGTTINPFLGSDPFRSFPVGMWTNPGVFPGVEEVRWNTNEAQYSACNLLVRNEYFYGVTTSGGYQAFTMNSAGTPPMVLPLTFIDQSNSVLLPANVSTRNIPFRSDHVLNLNL